MPEKILLNGRFSHIQQVDTRLDFLTFWLNNGQILLEGSEAEKVWKTLYVGALYPSDKEACLKWFSGLMGEAEKGVGTLLDSEHHLDFLTNKVLQIDPKNLTESGFECFERFFFAVNIEEKKMILKLGYCATEDLQLVGLEYVWRVMTTSPTITANKAAVLLAEIHANLGPTLLPSRDSIQENFFDSCFKQLKCFFDAINTAINTAFKTKKDENIIIDVEKVKVKLYALMGVLRALEQYLFLRDSLGISTSTEMHGGRSQHEIAKNDPINCSLEYARKVSCHVSLLKQLAEWVTQLPLETEPLKTLVESLLTSRLLNPPLKAVLQPRDLLAHDFDKLLLSSASSDVVFVVGEEEIPAHKLVLNTRLPYFEQLFSSGTCF